MSAHTEPAKSAHGKQTMRSPSTMAGGGVEVLGQDGVRMIPVTPFTDQKPGTSGLRKPVARFETAHYVATFMQSVFWTMDNLQGATLIVGGDGRYFSDTALDIILRVAAANGVGRIVLGRHGWLSTPALANLIVTEKAHGGIALTASHNPAGPDGDFGIKYNTASGGPAPTSVTDAIYEASLKLDSYAYWAGDHDCDSGQLGSYSIGEMRVDVVDPVKAYADMLRGQIDFAAISDLFASGFSMVFDAMHAISGPYAKAILEDELGAPAGTVINAVPLPDFGGGHPDPNARTLHHLVELMAGEDAPDFAAASDGDGDRNLVFGHDGPVSPSDSLAVLCANAHHVPAFAAGIRGVARSMPTTCAVDRVADRLGIRTYVTPTGWKYFGSLLDAGVIQLCGEESAGTGANHVREKDGLWAVLMWLNILARRREPVTAIMQDHWATYGRDLSTRLDFEDVKGEDAKRVLDSLQSRLLQLPGHVFEGLAITDAGRFDYEDPLSGQMTHNQGFVVSFGDAGRFVLRASGTGTRGVTLRLYCERGLHAAAALADETICREKLGAVVAAALKITEIPRLTGRPVSHWAVG